MAMLLVVLSAMAMLCLGCEPLPQPPPPVPITVTFSPTVLPTTTNTAIPSSTPTFVVPTATPSATASPPFTPVPTTRPSPTVNPTPTTTPVVAVTRRLLFVYVPGCSDCERQKPIISQFAAAHPEVTVTGVSIDELDDEQQKLIQGTSGHPVMLFHIGEVKRLVVGESSLAALEEQYTVFKALDSPTPKVKQG